MHGHLWIGSWIGKKIVLNDIVKIICKTEIWILDEITSKLKCVCPKSKDIMLHNNRVMIKFKICNIIQYCWWVTECDVFSICSNSSEKVLLTYIKKMINQSGKMKNVSNWCIRIKVVRNICIHPATSCQIATYILLNFYFEKIWNIWGNSLNLANPQFNSIW